MALIKRISLDTNIFIKENYLEGKRIRELLKLSEEGELELVLSIITINEVKSRFRKAAKQAIELHNQLLNREEIRVLRNLPTDKHKVEKFAPVKRVTDDFNQQLDEALKKAKVIIVPYPTLDISSIFEDYFNNRPPFHKADKKHEFPDAFALASLEQWCQTKRKKCIVFSKDKDFLDKKSRFLQIESSYESYLEDALKRIAPERMALLPKLYQLNDAKFEATFKEWLTDQLDDDTKYYEHTNYMDVHDIIIKNIKVEDKHFEVINLDEEQIEVEVTMDALVEVELVIDDEASYYKDEDDKSIHYWDTTKLLLEKEVSIPMVISFFIESKDEYDEDFEVVSINNDEEFSLPYDHYFY